MDITSFSSVKEHLDFLLRQGVKNDVFPGGAATIYSIHEGNGIEVVSTSGRTRLDEKGRLIDLNIVFDLASLTKALATSLSVCCLIEQGILNLEDRFIDICKRKIPPNKKNITIAHLLSHSSGLSQYRPYFESFKPVSGKKNKEELVKRIVQDPLEYETGAMCRYSDLGFILLGEIIEKVSAQPLDHFFQEQITAPLGLAEDLFFLPLSKKEKDLHKKQFAATELCQWRNRIIQGEVHDEHCFLMGGVAGHAGLFGTINGVMRICTSILDSWQGRESKLPISQKLLYKALTRKYSDRTWCLGFDTLSTGYTSGGKYLSKRSIGHLGYTGTSFWIDPERKTVLILLTNRVHPTRNNTKIREFRPWFHDRIMEFLFDPDWSGK